MKTLSNSRLQTPSTADVSRTSHRTQMMLLALLALLTLLAMAGMAGCAQGADYPGEAVCGNGQIEEGEACDDGNTTDGDGCSAVCALEQAAACGNSMSER